MSENQSGPITLATLPRASEQEVFEQVAFHLVQQSCRSIVIDSNVGEVGCKYRTYDTEAKKELHCAAGCLISEDEYEAEWEGSSWGHLAQISAVPKAHVNLISQLQNIHDNTFARCWPTSLRYLAVTRNLTIPEFLSVAVRIQEGVARHE